MLGEGFDGGQRLAPTGAVPVAEQVVPVQRGPFQDEPRCPRRDGTGERPAVDGEGRGLAGVTGVEVDDGVTALVVGIQMVMP